MLVLALPCLAQDSVKFKTQKHHRTAYDGRCVIEASYPEIEGRPDLNSKIKALLPLPVKNDDSEPGEVLKITQDFEVSYNANGLLSVYGTGLMIPTKNGIMNAAHPSKLFSGIVLDIKSGQAYSLRDMFGNDVYTKLDGRIAKAAAKAAEIEELRMTEHTYRAYLSAQGVTFYQIFDDFALGAVEVTIPFAEAAELGKPSGPLSRFKVK